MAILDKLFFLFHTALIIFVLTGWIWKKTRLAHLISVSLIAFSWLGLGACYGIGYCPCTDWHWQIKRGLGETSLPLSYVKYLVDSVLGSDVDGQFIDLLTGALFLAASLLSLLLSWRDFRR